MRTGTSFTAETHRNAQLVADRLEVITPQPDTLDVTITDGEVDETLRVEILHWLPMCITQAGDNLNGVDWDTEEDVLVLAECAARYTTEDGTVGYGHFERSTRRSQLRAG